MAFLLLERYNIDLQDVKLSSNFNDNDGIKLQIFWSQLHVTATFQ